MNNITELSRDLFVYSDENNTSHSEKFKVLPLTSLDQVIDTESNKSLRTILEELHQEIITGGRGNIKFPVTSVNSMTDDVIITKKNIGLENVDNTSDDDKPLSGPQKNAILNILKNYNFKVNMDDLYSHLTNTENPHDVTLEQINKNDELASFVKHYIGLHNTSQNNTVHADMRGSLRRLWTLVDEMNNTFELNVNKVLGSIDDHITDESAHLNILKLKEDLSNKTIEFTSTNNVDNNKYPTTRAVVNYVNNKLNEFNKSLPDVKYWIDNIEVIDKREDLPKASVNTYHTMYIIRYGDSYTSEIAICKFNASANVYEWDISHLGSYTQYNKDHFTQSIYGLSINIDTIVDSILDKESGILDNSLSQKLNNYYTIDEIKSFNFINNLKILPGTTDGTIRFYINDEIMSMSDDIQVAGLKRLGYLEWVTENEISDNAIHENHIMHKSIATKHIQNRAVKAPNIECKYGCIIGNDSDSENNTSNYITLEQLAEYLRPLIGGWPDPNIPGGNPWYDRLSTQLLQTHTWFPGVEYDFGNGCYAVRFTGKISCIANMDHKLKLTENITTATGFQIMDAGGSWMYQSEPDIEWTILSGSNITGHTFATITMDKNGLYLETISIGNRIDAPFDIWVKYIKTEDYDKYPMIPPFEE